jgi:hypothetical protein
VIDAGRADSQRVNNQVSGISLVGEAAAPHSTSGLLRKLPFAVLLLAYFVYFNRDALPVHFAPDDMMNIEYAWRYPPLQVLLAQFTPWSGFYRPMGGLFYIALFAVAGFNPVPYHYVLLSLLLADVYLLYRLARLLGASETAAGLAALIACYQGGLVNLNYNIAFSYDVLCGFFYLCALVYYLQIRERGRLLRGRETLAFFALYLCALNSKEMAPTLPAILLVYEWLYHRPAIRSGSSLVQWLRGPGRVALLAGALNLVYLYGKLWRPGAMAKSGGYVMAFTRQRVSDFQIRYFADLLEKWGYFGLGGAVALWAALFYLAWRRDRPVLRFCWLFLLITPLPLVFIEGRAGACFYIPFMGWAIFTAVVFTDLAQGAADVLAREPAFRFLGRRILFALLCVVAVFFWARGQDYLRKSYAEPAMAALGQQTWEVLQQFQALHPHVRRHSTVIFLNDPFEDWDIAFIGELWFRDRSITVRALRKTPMTPAEIASADHLFDYRDGKFVQLK